MHSNQTAHTNSRQYPALMLTVINRIADWFSTIFTSILAVDKITELLIKRAAHELQEGRMVIPEELL